MVNWSSGLLALQIRLQTGVQESVMYDEMTIKTLKQIFLLLHKYIINDFPFTHTHTHLHTHTSAKKRERETSALSSSAIQAAL
jgi:hypothetical protein